MSSNHQSSLAPVLPAGRFGGAIEFIKNRSRQKGQLKYPLEIVALALQRTNGMVFKAAELLKCSPATIYKYLDEHPELREIREAEKGLLLDKAEAQLASAIEDREAWAVCFFLKTQGKERGYIERQEHTGADGQPIQVTAVDRNEIKRERLTAAVQRFLDEGHGDLKAALEFFLLKGVTQDELALIRGGDLTIPDVINVTPVKASSNGNHNSDGHLSDALVLGVTNSSANGADKS